MVVRMRYANLLLRFFVFVSSIGEMRHSCPLCVRYSEFDDLRQRLESAFPHARNALPALPPKSVLCTDSQPSQLQLTDQDIQTNR